MAKSKIKKNTKSITVYMSEEKYNELDDITNQKNMSFNEWIRGAIEFKLRYDSNAVNGEADKLLTRLQNRINELKGKPEELKRPDVLDELYAKTKEWRTKKDSKFNGQQI